MSSISYYVIYDGNCNLCVTLVKLLETLDQGKIFHYIPMQDEQAIAQWEITPQGCELGVILIDAKVGKEATQPKKLVVYCPLVVFLSMLIELYRG